MNRPRFAWIALALLGAAAYPGGAQAAEPQVLLSVIDVNFGQQAQETSSQPAIVVLTNSGEAELTIASISLSGVNDTEFRQTNTCPIAPAVLGPKSQCQISVVFRPRVAGSLVATLAISDNASGSPRSVALHGEGTPPAPGLVVSPAGLSFANQPVNTQSPPSLVVIANSGSAPLNITSAIAITGEAKDEFRLQRPPSGACTDGSTQLPPRSRCELSVVFAPVSLGTKSAQLVVMSDAPGSPHRVAITGNATGSGSN